MAKITLHTPPKFLRAGITRGLAGGESPVERTGGDNGAGLIRGVAVITRGEALGHRMWIDRTMLGQVHAAITGSSMGAKSRFTHPGLSSDGLGSYLGRVKNGRLDGDVVRGDLHLARTAHQTPDGNLANYVMDLAEEDPASFGMSIVFEPDYGAEHRFEADHEDQDGNFRSPDPDNTNNYFHARLAVLRTVDTVDEPAANPEGFFHRSQVVQEADQLLAYSLGLSEAKPTNRSFDLDPDRAARFVQRFLDRHDLQISRRETMSKGTKLDENKPAEEQEVTPASPADATPTETDTGGETSPTTPAADGDKPAEQSSRDECKKFVAAFGAQGGLWFAEGKTYDEAMRLHVAALKSENEELKKKLQGANRGEITPLSSGPPSGQEENDSLVPKLGENLAKVARGMKLASSKN